MQVFLVEMVMNRALEPKNNTIVLAVLMENLRLKEYKRGEFF